MALPYLPEMIEKAKEKESFTSELLKKNQLEAVETVKELERSYRQIQLFYKNTESDKLRNITIVNASPEQIRDLDNSRFIEFKILNNTNLINNETKVLPAYGQIGKGAEFMTKNIVEIDLINWQILR